MNYTIDCKDHSLWPCRKSNRKHNYIDLRSEKIFSRPFSSLAMTKSKIYKLNTFLNKEITLNSQKCVQQLENADINRPNTRTCKHFHRASFNIGLASSSG